MNYLFKFSILSFVLITFLGCDKEEEPIPAYLHIKKFTFTTKKDTEGLNTFDVGDAKVFANGKEIGTFELPVTIPVIQTGNVVITLIPNIKENGSANYHKAYRPYVSFADTLVLEPLKVDTIAPKTVYRSNTNFAWMEDFDDYPILPQFQKYGLNNSNDSMTVLSTGMPGINQPFTGSTHCGFINIAASDSAIDFERTAFSTSTSSGWMTKPSLPATDIYFEMDYKSNANIQVGVYTLDINNVVERHVVLFTYPTENWKKIYINLISELGDLPATTKFRVFVGVYKPGDGISEPKVFIDNLKLLYVE